MLRQALLLLLLAAVAGALTGVFHPYAPTYDPSPRSPLARTWEEVDALPEPKLFLDARTLAEYEEQHLPGALHLSEDDWENGFETLMMAWDPAQTLIVYCAVDSCHASAAVAQRLRHEFAGLDYDQIFFLQDNWQARLEEASR